MRIIAGSHKGRRLTPPKDNTARPTADRAREALFSILTSRDAIFDQCIVLDCFAGTGALGLEALSRGAGHATFMEFNPSALSVIKANVASLDWPMPAQSSRPMPPSHQQPPALAIWCF